MDRGLELRMKGHLWEIEKIDDEVIDDGRGQPPAMNGYRKTLESVAECAGAEMVDAIGDEVKERIRSSGDRPDNQSVRKDAARRIAENNIVPDDYLMRA